MKYLKVELGDEIIYTCIPPRQDQSIISLINCADVVINKKNEVLKCRFSLDTDFEDFLRMQAAGWVSSDS
jgi:hypothetical protein